MRFEGRVVLSFTYTADGKRQTMADASGTTTVNLPYSPPFARTIPASHVALR
jgi:hypothetical protein